MGERDGLFVGTAMEPGSSGRRRRYSRRGWVAAEKGRD